MVSKKEVEKEIFELLEEYNTAKEIFKKVLNNNYIKVLYEQSNIVSVDRLNYNDHGIVHGLIVARNSIKIAKILKKWGYLFNVEENHKYSFEDAIVVISLSALLHDVGNSIHRSGHALLSVILLKDFIEKTLRKYYDEEKSIKITLEILSAIISHQGSQNLPAISLEAKVVAISDGLDMEEGRARIAYKIGKPDIHKYSALSIKKVEISEGKVAPVRVSIYMNNPSGVFQVERVFGKKVDVANAWDLLEIYLYIDNPKDTIKIIKGKKIVERESY